jgi:hypothetical protein
MVYATVGSMKPAHLNYQVNFEQSDHVSLYVGWLAQVCKKITLNQVN